jgi:hypothetical protein
MSDKFGVKVVGEDGFLRLHSDYSSITYVGKVLNFSTPSKVKYSGDGSQGISDADMINVFNVGWLVQCKYDAIPCDAIVPFYKPFFSGQQVCIVDVEKVGNGWVITLLYSGSSTSIPAVYMFAPMVNIPQATALSGDPSVSVFDAAGKVVFSSSKKILKVDDVVSITYPSTARTNATSAGDVKANSSVQCTGNVVPNEYSIFHLVTSGYSGTVYKASSSGTSKCSCSGLPFGGEVCLGKRSWANITHYWTSCRGAVTHTFGSSSYSVGWLGDSAGKYYKYSASSCKTIFDDPIGAFLGVLGVLFVGATFGLGTSFLIGLAIIAISVNGVSSKPPSVAFYENNEVHDISSSTMLVTDSRYYE